MPITDEDAPTSQAPATNLAEGEVDLSVEVARAEGASLSRYLPVGKIRPGNDLRNGDNDIGDLLESFEHAPQIHPILVRPISGAPPFSFECVCGNRRLRAAKEKGWQVIESKIVEADAATAEHLALEENVRRKGLPNEAAAITRLTEICTAQGVRKNGGDRRSAAFKESHGRGDQLKSAATLVAEKTGKSPRTIRRIVRIQKRGSPMVRRALERNEISEAEAAALVRLPEEKQDAKLVLLSNARPSPTLPVPARKALEASAFLKKIISEHGRTFSSKVINELRATNRSIGVALRGLSPKGGSRAR